MATVKSTAGASTEQAEPNPLLERADHLAALDAHLAVVRERGMGRLVFVGGEAGAGKTALLRRFEAAHAGSVRRLAGACDALFTPRPLGPFLDIAPLVGGEFAALAERGGRPYEIATALLRVLAAGAPSILVVEDAHWADDATLDVLRFLGRRIQSVPALVLVTYRDELPRTHPLRILLGELPTGETVFRLQLGPLSPRAVAELAEPHGVNAADLFRLTAGNPFFVTEALAAGAGTIPPTVRDAVLARIARLPPAASALLEAVAIVPQQTDLWLLERLAGSDLEHLDAALAAGILAHTEGAVTYRHELARLAIEETLTPLRRTLLHRRALQALETPPTGPPDLARLVHHAEAAAEADALLRFAPAAAAHAASLGAHREAAAHYARALRVAGGLPPAARGALFERYAQESFLTDQVDAAVAAGWEAVACYRAAEDRVREGDALRQLSRILRCTGFAHEAEEVAMRAVALLEQLPPGRELALAYANVAFVCMNLEDAARTSAFGWRTHALAEALEDAETLLHVLNTLGTMELLVDNPEGLPKLLRSLDMAMAEGMEEHVGRVYLNLGWAANRTRAYADFDRHLTAGIEYCNERGLVLWQRYLLAYGARYALDQGRWSAAVDLARQVVHDPRTTLPRIPALVVIALVRARRGDPECWQPLDEALALAEPTGELQHVAPVAAARAEVAWLEGRPEAVAEATGATLALAIQRRASWVVGELACWRRRAGLDAGLDDAAEPVEPAEPYALELAGHWARAAAFWTQRGCPYEAALARAGSNDEVALRETHAALQRLGARAAASVAARRLRELGALSIPRGPRPGTRANAVHLTARELEVLTLLAHGLHNAGIAARLSLSPKTVDHHVSAVLAKLDSHTRADAVRAADRLGLLDPAPDH